MNADELLLHADFVKKLSRHLVWDENQAADLAQDTFLAALQNPTARLESHRAWLATVIRNFRGKLIRSESRRQKREGHAALPDVVPSTEEIITREEMRSRVVRAVLDLKEPYRSHILLRFYEDMPPRKIAGHVGVPTETVRTRIKKGLDLLRTRLDADYGGDRKAWCLALLPLAGLKAAAAAGAATSTASSTVASTAATAPASSAAVASGAATSSTAAQAASTAAVSGAAASAPAGAGTLTSLIGALIMTAKWKIAIVSVMTLAATFGIWNVFSGGDEPATDTSQADAPVMVAQQDEQKPQETPQDDLKKRLENLGYAKLESLGYGKGSRKESIPASGAAVRGRIVNARKEVVEGAEIFIRESGGEARSVAESDDRGRFTTKKLKPGRYWVHAESESGTRSVRQSVKVENDELPELILTLEEWHEISGTVVSADDATPIEGARITATGIGDTQHYNTQTDKDGKYVLEGLSRTYFVLDVTAPDFGRIIREGIVFDSKGVDFTLHRPGTLKGKVTDSATGAPIRNFHVRLIPMNEQVEDPASLNEALQSIMHVAYFQQLHDLNLFKEFRDEQGRFTIAPLGSGNYRLAVGADGYSVGMLPKPLAIEPGRETYHEFSLISSHPLTGRIVEAETGLPIEGAAFSKFTLSDLYDRNDPLAAHRTAFTGWDGCFKYTFASKGHNLLRASHHDFKEKVVSVHMDNGQLTLGTGNQKGISIDENGLSITLRKKQDPGRLQVQVATDLMESCKAPPVIALFPASGESKIVVPDAQGCYLSGELDAGYYNVQLMGDAAPLGLKEVVIKPMDTAFVSFGKTGGAGISVRGSLYMGSARFDGEGMINLVRFHEKGNQPVGMVPLVDGRFSITGIEPGRGELRLFLTSGAGIVTGLAKKMSWGEVPDQMLNIALPMTNVTVKVSSGINGQPLPDAAIELKAKKKPELHNEWNLKMPALSRTDAGGEALVQCVPEGSYTLTVAKDGHEKHEQSLLIIEGKPVTIEVNL